MNALYGEVPVPQRNVQVNRDSNQEAIVSQYLANNPSVGGWDYILSENGDRKFLIIKKRNGVKEGYDLRVTADVKKATHLYGQLPA